MTKMPSLLPTVHGALKINLRSGVHTSVLSIPSLATSLPLQLPVQGFCLLHISYQGA